MYVCHIENVAYGEINERGFSNPHPRSLCIKHVTEQAVLFLYYILWKYRHEASKFRQLKYSWR